MNPHPVESPLLPGKVAGMPSWSAHAGSLRRHMHAVHDNVHDGLKIHERLPRPLALTTTGRFRLYRYSAPTSVPARGGGPRQVRWGQACAAEKSQEPGLKQLATAALLRRPPAFRGSRCTRPRSRAAGLRAGSRPPRARRRSCRGTRGSASAASSR